MRIDMRRACLPFAFLLLAISVVAQAQPPPRFDGIQITVGVQDVSAIGSPARAHARTWEQRTGGSVQVIASPFDELFGRYLDSLAADEPVYDVILYAPAWAGDFHPYLSELPRRIAEDESLDDIHPVYRDRLMTWEGKWIAVTVDGDLFSGYYRKDLFEDPSVRAAFRARYSYELAPPDTWAQYRDIAEFFTGRVEPDGAPLYGTVEAFARGGQQFWDVFSRASAYTNNPRFPGAQFFDPDTMRAQVNNPGWVRAAEEYVDILQFCPPGAEDFGIVQARDAFVSGRTAMILDWGDTAQNANDSRDSKIRGKVGYFVLPGAEQSWNGRTWRWDAMGGPYKAPFLAFGGWVASVPNNSQQQAAAWDYIMWYGNPQNSLQDVISAGTGINPYRWTHFADIDAWTAAFSRRAASEYLNVLRNSLNSPNVALDLRVPGFFRYTTALEVQLSKALNRELSVKEAMDKVAAEWNVITESLGYEKQRKIYRASMGLAPEPAGPRPGSGRDKERLLIGFSQATTTEPWRLLFNKELREEAARHPEIELVVRDGLDDERKQSGDVEEMIALGVDAILLSPKVAEGLTPVVSKAFELGIPVFVLDRDVANDRYAQFIGGDNREIGRAAGRYAVEYLGGPGRAKGKIVEIWGGMASTPAQDRHKGFVEVIAREPGVEIVNRRQDGDWKQDLGYEIMEEALDQHPRIELVYAHNDPMAYGAYLAAKDAQRESEIAFLGIDGIPAEGVRWVHDGILTATFLYKTPGEEAIRQALRYLRGESTPKRVTLPTMTIERSIAAEILEHNGLE
jgi:multiple sugar transport system substrate-binding protein